MKNINVLGYGFALLGASFFSLKAVLVKLAYLPVDGMELNALDPITLLALRMGFALPVYLVIAAFIIKRGRRVALKPALQAYVLGILGYYLCAYLDFSGLKYITAQLERILLFTYPIYVVILGALFFGGKITKSGVAAMLLAYLGIAIIFAGGDIASGENVLLGTVMILATAFLFAMFQLFAKGLINQMGSWLFTCIAMSGAATSILVHFAIQNGMDGGAASALDLPTRIYWIGLSIAFFSTIIPSFLVNIAIDKIGAQATAVMAMIGPITTILAAIVLLEEPFGWVDAVGTVVTMSGIGLYTWLDRKHQPIKVMPLKT